MGSYFSRQDVYLNEFTNPLVSEHSRDFMVKCTWNGEEFVYSKENPFACLVSEKLPDQYVVILDILLTYVQSELDITLCISNLFRNQFNEDVPDNNLVILCPKNSDYPVQGNDRILYKAKVHKEYVGFEDAVMEAKASDVFARNHPVYILAAGMISESGRISEQDLAIIQRAFPRYTPTRFEETRCKATGNNLRVGKGACVMLRMKYLLVNPGDMKFKIKEVKI